MLLPRFFFSDEFNEFADAFHECGATRIIFPAGEYICNPSDTLYFSYYICSGITRLSILCDDGMDLIIGFWGAGSIYPLICNQQEFTLEPHIILTAITEVETLALPPSGMQRLLTECPHFSINAIDHYCKFTNLLLVRNMLSVESDSVGKISNFLYLYCHYLPQPANEIPLSQEDIASITGLTRVQVNRVLRKLRNDKVLETSRGKVIIYNKQALKEYCLSLVQNELISPKQES